MKRQRKSKKIELLVAQGLNDFKSGEHRSFLKGWGGDLDSAHPWQPDDRRIAMAATAKTGEVMSKVFEEPKLLTVWLVVDISHSMYFGSEIFFGEAAVVIARVLGNSVSNCGDLLGAVLFDSQLRRFSEPQAGDSLSRAVANLILEHEPNVAPTHLLAALERLAQAQPQNALVVIISDFNFDIDKGSQLLLRQINEGINNSLVCLVLYDEQELAGVRQPFVVTIRDAENDINLSWDMSSGVMTKDLQAAARERRDQLASQLRHSNSETVFLDISKNYMRNLAKFFSKSVR